MSNETIEDLNRYTLIGMTDLRDEAWHKVEELQLPWEILLPDGRVLSGVGNHYPGEIPVEHVAARLFNWTAVPRRIAVEVPASLTEFDHYVDGKPMLWRPETDLQAITRDDTHRRLGIFGLRYTPHQYYEWLVKGVADILDDELAIASAGLLAGGAQAWVQVSLPETIEVAGMTALPWMMATTSFDGSTATTYKPGTQIVVCDNTRNIALGEDTPVVRVPHTMKSLTKLGEIRQDLGVAFAAIKDAFSAEIEKLATTPVSQYQFKQVIEALVPINELQDGPRKQTMAQTKREQLTKLYNWDLRCLQWRDTALGVQQTFSTYNHWVQGGIGGTDPTERDLRRGLRNSQRAFDNTTAKQDAEVMAALADILG